MSTVRINHITKAFGENVVLKEFNETFDHGEFVTLLGPSGCGKTTMLRIIAGFEHPTEGELYIDDTLVSSNRAFVPPEKRNVGMVFQSYAVWPHMNVFNNVAYPLSIKRIPKAKIAEEVDRVLSIVHLNQYSERFPNQLSGGQQQRVALARALVAAPGLLLLDEPLSNLDAKLRESMRFEIKEIQRNLNITVVYVTHDQTEAMAMSDRIFLINRGVVQQSGTPEEIYNRPVNQFVADFLGKVQFFKGTTENGMIRFAEMEGQTLPYDGPKTGNVEAAIRPERIRIAKEETPGALKGTMEQSYYLGDVNDVRVRVGQTTVRVIADAWTYNEFQTGDTVYLTPVDFLVFDDEGSLQEQLQINT
ncbi:MAG TPA: ABC transporter ATP-binding protein [Candidatus Limiplasma sp.]|nr:ABC transporter ATP-binding protein [Candidatus Limiplasma sp.]HPJ03807.1 ABC transporter ATP-binding protein [Candidatus Limiplasma sp.]